MYDALREAQSELLEGLVEAEAAMNDLYVTNNRMAQARNILARAPQQPTPTDIEISNQRAAELTAARAEIARLQAENARLPALSRNIIGRNVYQDLHNVYSTLNDFDLSSDEALRRVLLFLRGMSTQSGWDWAAPPQPPQGMAQADAFAVPGAVGAR